MAASDGKEYLSTQLDAHSHKPDGKTISRRAFAHGKHEVVIEATYQIFVDGKVRDAHFSIGEDGRAVTHMMPYKSYPSLVELVSDLIDKFPNEFGGDSDA